MLGFTSKGGIHASSCSSSSSSLLTDFTFNGVNLRTGVSVAVEVLPSSAVAPREMFGGAPRAFFGVNCGSTGLSVVVATGFTASTGDRTAVIGRIVAVSTGA